MIVTVKEPFGAEKTVQIDNPHHYPLGKLLDPYTAHVEEVWVNGEPCDAWQAWDGSVGHVDIFLRPREPISASITLATITTALITASIGVALSLGIHFLMAALTPKSVGKESGRPEEIFGIAGLTNTVALGTPKMLIYGERRAFGHIISTKVDVSSDGRSTAFGALYYMGEGEVEQIHRVEINDTASEQYGGVSTVTRHGSADQSVIPGFESISQVFSDGRQLPFASSNIIYTGRGTTFDHATLIFGTPFLFNTNEGSGKRTSAAHNLIVRYKKVSDGGWTDAPGIPIEWRDNMASIGFKAVGVSLPSKAQWQFQVSLASTSNDNQTPPTLYNVQESESTSLNYPNCALLAVFGVASAQITSFEGMRVSAIVRGRRVKIWTGVQYVTAWTDNRVWIVRDLLTDDRIGLGSHIPESMWNEQTALESSVFYLETINGEQRDSCDLIVNDRRPGWDWIKEILAEGRAILLPSGGQFKYVINRNRLPNLLYSSPGNILEGSMHPTMGTGTTPPNTMRGEFPNGARGDLLDIVQVRAAGTEAEDLREATMSFRTITRESQVFRELSFYLKRDRSVKRRWQWKSPQSAMVSEPFDVDQLAYTTTNNRRGQSGRCSALCTTTVVELDRLVTLEAGKTYTAIIRHIGAGRSNVTERKTVSMPVGIFGRVTLGSPLIYAPEEGDIWAIGEQNTQVKSVLIEDVSEADGEYTITASEFIAANYDSVALPPPGNIPPIQHTGSLPIPLLSASVTYEPTQEPDGTTIPMLRFQVTPGQSIRGGTVQSAASGSIRLAQGEPDIDDYFNGTRIKIVEGVGTGSERLITDYAGSTRTAQIDAAWANIPNVNSRYEAHWDNYGDFSGFDIEANDLSGVFYFLASVIGSIVMLPARGGQESNQYRFTPFSVQGVRNLNARWIKGVTQTGDIIPPNPPSGLTAIGTFGAIVLSWSNPADADFDVVEVFSALANDRAQAQFNFYVRGTGAFHSPLPAGQRRWYWIRARDRSGNTSDFHPFNPFDGVFGTVVGIDFSHIDTEPPAVPVGLIVTTGVTINPDGTVVPWIQARWTPNSEQDIGHYQVQFRVVQAPGQPANAPMIISTTIAEARWDGAPGGKQVGVSVAAIDRFGNPSALTGEWLVTTASDTQGPAPITLLQATPAYKANMLLWSPPGDLDYELTEIYASTVNNLTTASRVGEGNYSFAHVGLPSNVTFFYWGRPRDTSGNFGAFHPGINQGVPCTTLNIPGSEIDERTIHPSKLIGDMRSLSTNSDFEAGPVGWTPGEPGWDIFNNAVFSRSGSWGVSRAPGFSSLGTIRNHTVIPVHPGDQFYVSQFYLKTVDTNGQVHAGLVWLDKNLNEIGAAAHPQLDASQAFSNAFVERAVIIAAPVDAVYARSFIQTINHTTGYWLMDDHLVLTAVAAQFIAANTISAVHMRTDTLIITTAAQIANATITTAHIQSLSADKISAGVIQALVSIGVGSNIFLHGPGKQIQVWDSQAPQRLRVQIGQVDGSPQGYGLRVFNAAGVMIWDISGVPTEGIQDGAVNAQKIRVGSIDSSHLRTDTIVVTGEAQIANLIVGTAKISNLAIETAKIANNAVSDVFVSNQGSGSVIGGAEVAMVGLGIGSVPSHLILLVCEFAITFGAGDTVAVRIRRDATNGPIIKEVFIVDRPAGAFFSDILYAHTQPTPGQAFYVTVTSFIAGCFVNSMKLTAVQFKK